MRLLVGLILAFAAAAASTTAARAGSLAEVQATLLKKEQYFQPLDKPAPNFTLRDANGNVHRLADFRGKVVVLHFIYTSCPDVCPLHAERIAEIQAMVNRTRMKDMVQFISITTDPEHDTPEVLRAYGPAHGLKDVNWLFLTTLPHQPTDLTRKLVEAYGHKFTRMDDGRLMHSVVTHVIDPEGRWRANFYGLDFSSANLILLVEALAGHNPESSTTGKSPWERLREFF
jgi:protein SCO1/2